MSSLLKDDNLAPIQLMAPQAAHQALNVSAVSAQSAALDETVSVVELYCESQCFVAIGANPTATTLGIPVYPGVPRYVDVAPKDKVAGVLAAGTDVLRIVGLK